jgi:hypothetical protein
MAKMEKKAVIGEVTEVERSGPGDGANYVVVKLPKWW